MIKPTETTENVMSDNQQKAHAALDEIERVGLRARLTIRSGIKAGAASMRAAVCYGCTPPDP
ncbi:MAG: hypothetical protein U0325_20990 [Polyangiales bacterium]